MLALYADPFASERFRPWVANDSYRPVFSLWYVTNALNLALLLVPAMILLVGMRAFARPMRGDERRFQHHTLAVVSVAPFVLMVILFEPDLGMTRDWDIYAIAAPFAILVLIPMTKRAPDALRAWTMPVLILSVLQTSAWVAVLADPRASEQRYRETLSRDPSHLGYAYEILAEYYDRRGLDREAFQTYMRALKADGNPRYAFSAGVKAAKLGETEEAVQLMRRCLRGDPSNHRARANLASYLVSQRDFGEVIRVTRSGLEYTPNDPYLNVFLAMALVETERYEEAYPQLRRCLTLPLNDDMKTDVSRALAFVKRRLADDR
jgi:hypothetical protein